MRRRSMLIAALLATACADKASAPSPSGSASPAPSPPAASSSAAPSASASARPVTVAPSPALAACPVSMAKIPGGAFAVGSDTPGSAPEEMPRFETQVATFCLGVTEVTVDAYSACVSAGKCEKAHDEGRFCNTRFSDRGDHPMNCVSWGQAQAYCQAQGARLPTELEWEYAARGGGEYRAFSWGSESPEGRTCWKHIGGSCKVKSFAAGAFGLYDMIGNVWEWTDDWFGDYPWPPPGGTNKVYRGGSWSRRFVKWMSPKLRNRWPPKLSGSHLGFRCALTPGDVICPFGRSADGQRCQHGVTTMACSGRTKWNGVRCARDGEPECPAGSEKKPGHGCAVALDVKGALPAADTAPVSRVRTPTHDADCQQNKPGRPSAYRYSGGTHHARNQVSAAAGCANRDVGVGWNSTCCP